MTLELVIYISGLELYPYKILLVVRHQQYLILEVVRNSILITLRNLKPLVMVLQYLVVYMFLVLQL